MDAGRRQLNTAIRLWFEGGDPVSIHTLAIASHDVIHHLFRRKGLKGLMFDSARIKPEFRQHWSSSLKRSANFFKHGRHDEEKAIVFDPGINRHILLASCTGLRRMKERLDMEQEALGYWVLFESPQFFDDAERLLAHPVVQVIEQIVPHGPKLFLRYFEEAWKRGLVNAPKRLDR